MKKKKKEKREGTRGPDVNIRKFSVQKKMFAGPTGTIYIRNVPKPMRDLFHAACARRGRPMRKVIMSLMRRYIKEEEKVFA